MTPAEMQRERRRMDKKVKAEALAAENAAVFNLGEIRKLEKRVTGRELTVKVLGEEIIKLQNALADVRRDHATLVGLATRMGEAVDILTEWYCNLGPLEGRHIDTNYPLTIIGERERRAATHEAEGPPVTREDCVP